MIDAVGPCRFGLKQAPSLFYALAEAITYQQLNGRAAETIFGRFKGLFPRAVDGPTPAHVLRASDEALRGAGLSRSKLQALRDLAEKVGAKTPLSAAHGDLLRRAVDKGWGDLDNSALILALTSH